MTPIMGFEEVKGQVAKSEHNGQCHGTYRAYMLASIRTGIDKAGVIFPGPGWGAHPQPFEAVEGHPRCAQRYVISAMCPLIPMHVAVVFWGLVSSGNTGVMLPTYSA